MIRTYVIQKEELENISYSEELFSRNRRDKISRLKRDEDKQLSACAELLLIYGIGQVLTEQPQLPLDIEEDERHKLQIAGLPLHFNLSHAKEYAACTIADAPVGVDIEYFKVRELMHPDRILHPEEVQLLGFISNPLEQKKYFYECWVSKESYLKNLGIGLIVRPRDFLVREDVLKIGAQEVSLPKGHHSPTVKTGEETGTLAENLSYLEQRYVHVLEPGEVRGTDWKFDASYRLAVCSMQKDPDSIARLIHAEEINAVLSEAKLIHTKQV